jgi:hypothetical protein
MSTAVAKAKETAVSTEVLEDLFDFDGEGTTYDSSELQIPFIRLLQPMSPQLNKNKPEFIKGASVGDIFNTVSGQFWDGQEGIKVVICYQTTKYLEFRQLEMGGGFIGEIPAGSAVLQQTIRSGAKELLPNNNELVKSDQHLCLVLDDEGSFQPAIIDMKSTQLKVSKRLKTNINQMPKIRSPKDGELKKIPLFGTVWRFFAVEETNDKGSWTNWNFEKVGLVENRDLLLEAAEFRRSIMAGEVKAAPEGQPEGFGVSASGNGDDEIPF